jgi:hypothetical protein
MSLPVSIRRLRVRIAPHRGGDRGAVAVLVALLLGSGLLIGLLALVVDMGNIYVEREQLQSGADAGAGKVAQVCAMDPATCASPEFASSAATIAGGYADDNSGDGTSEVSVVCGRGGDLGPCPPPTGTAADCVKDAPETGDYIEIHTGTRLADGSTALPPVFAEAVISGYRGATVTACARARWGPAAAARLSLAVSVCDWNAGTGGGTLFPDPPVEQVIALHDQNTAPCRPDGLIGGFGWLDDPNRDCGTPVEVNGAYQGDPGNDVSYACEDMLTRLRGRAALMPVYSAATGPDGNFTYTVLGIAAFVVTGWNLPGFQQPSPTGTSACGVSPSCIFGYFTRTTVAGGAIGGPDLGAYSAGLVG